jgi:hypothetical protein
MRLLRSGMRSLMNEGVIRERCCTNFLRHAGSALVETERYSCERCFRDQYCIGFFATRREPVHGGSGRASMRATVSKKPIQH